MTETAAALPPLPDPVPTEELRELDEGALAALDGELTSLERATLAAMSPFERRLREVRARQAELATERRRRERASRHAARTAVREQARSGGMPAFVEALEAAETIVPDERRLADIRAFLTTGGEVRFGYPSRPGSISFTDGRRLASATTWGEARRLYGEGLEPGTPGLPGVRVHLAGTRVEKVVAGSDVVVAREVAGGGAAG